MGRRNRLSSLGRLKYLLGIGTWVKLFSNRHNQHRHRKQPAPRVRMSEEEGKDGMGLDVDLLQRAKQLAGSADHVVKDMDKESAKYVVSQSIGQLPEKLRRRDIRTYLNDEPKSMQDGGSSPFGCKEESKSPSVVLSTPPVKQMDNLDMSLCHPVQFNCTYPTSMWKAFETFHICTSSHVSHVIIEADAAVDFVTLHCSGVDTLYITGADSNGFEIGSTYGVDSKFDAIQKIESKLEISTRKIIVYIKSRTEMFPCIFKISGRSTIRSSMASTPIKGQSPDEGFSKGVIGANVGGAAATGKATIIQRPMSGRLDGNSSRMATMGRK